ncbi:DUF7882 family protein [Rathayibacter sp. CAU 1779]
MGYVIYQGERYRFEDRTLAHVHIVVIDKLRHGESFALSWRIPLSEGSGRTSLWLHPSADLTFHFDGSRSPNINAAWVLALRAAADSSRGLVLMEEESVVEAVRA